MLLNVNLLCSVAEVQAALSPLVRELWQRLQDDAAEHARLPVKLSLAWRCGYNKQQSKVLQMPSSILKQMRQLLLMPGSGNQLFLQHASSSSTSRKYPHSGIGSHSEAGGGMPAGEAPGGHRLGADEPYGAVTPATAVCDDLVKAYLGAIVPLAAVAGSSSSVTGKTRLTAQKGASVSAATADGSPKQLNITRLSVGVLFADST